MSRTKYVCQQCSTTYSKWSGRCDNCGAWNSLVESVDLRSAGKAIVSRSKGTKLSATSFSDVQVDKVSDRLSTGLSDVDIVLGGGLMPGGVILVAGEPGIG